MKINFPGDVKPHMNRSILLSVFLFVSMMVYGIASAADLIGPETRVADNDLLVTTSLVLDEKSLNELKRGISKEIVFQVDLFRVWRLWPDEFIAGKRVVKTLLSDPVKKEHIGTSFDGTTMIEKRFKSLDSMLEWTLTIKDLRLVNTKELELSDYFVRVTMESRLKKLPPVIGYLLFFVPEKEFNLSRNSSFLTLGVPR